jgi:hypothetical protein
VRIKAAVEVDDPGEVGRPAWKTGGRSTEGRALVITIGDLLMVLSEPAAGWLLALLAAIVDPTSEPEGQREPIFRRTRGTRVADVLDMRIELALHVYRPGDVGRPRWEGRELVFSVGNLVLVFSEPAARWFLRMLAAAFAAGQPRRPSGSEPH